MEILASRDFTKDDRVIEREVTTNGEVVTGRARYLEKDLIYREENGHMTTLGWTMTAEDYELMKADIGHANTTDDLLQSIADEIVLRWDDIQFNDE